MRLLIDTDAFCKLAASDLLSDAVGLFHAELHECGRLPALPYMLRRGGLRRSYGAAVCERLIPLAEAVPPVEHEATAWLERLTPIHSIDPGEAVLFSVAADLRLPVITGDVRSLRALKRLNGFPEALAGRVVVLEAVFLALCAELGAAAVRAKVASGRLADIVMRICFSPEVQEPEVGLISYLRDRRTELVPLVLWGTGEREE